MKPSDAAMAGLIEELLGALDEQIALLETRRRQLGSLSAAIIDRDEESMERLLEEIEQTLQSQASADLRLSAVRATIAQAVGCERRQLRLSWLIGRVESSLALALEYRRRRLMLLADELRRQHLSTAVLLVECSRINQMLLESLLPQSEPLTTYRAGGADSWRPDTGLVDAEL